MRKISCIYYLNVISLLRFYLFRCLIWMDFFSDPLCCCFFFFYEVQQFNSSEKNFYFFVISCSVYFLWREKNDRRFAGIHSAPKIQSSKKRITSILLSVPSST